MRTADATRELQCAGGCALALPITRCDAGIDNQGGMLPGALVARIDRGQTALRRCAIVGVRNTSLVSSSARMRCAGPSRSSNCPLCTRPPESRTNEEHEHDRQRNQQDQDFHAQSAHIRATSCTSTAHVAASGSGNVPLVRATRSALATTTSEDIDIPTRRGQRRDEVRMPRRESRSRCRQRPRRGSRARRASVRRACAIASHDPRQFVGTARRRRRSIARAASRSPRLTDTCACASDGASLMPSPTIATIAPSACSAAIAARLSSGERVAARMLDSEAPRRLPRPLARDRPTGASARCRGARSRATRPSRAGPHGVAEPEEREKAPVVAQRDQRGGRDRNPRPRRAAARPDSAATNSGRPRRVVRPSMTPSTPRPGTVRSAATRDAVAVPRRPRERRAPADAPIAPRAPPRARWRPRASTAPPLLARRAARPAPASAFRSCRARRASRAASVSSASRARDDDLPPGERAGRGRERRRRRQRQRARTGHDQHREGDRQRARRVVLPPGQRDDDRQEQQRTDEPRRRHDRRRGRRAAARSRRARPGAAIAASRVASPAAVTRTHERPVARRRCPRARRRPARLHAAAIRR